MNINYPNLDENVRKILIIALAVLVLVLSYVSLHPESMLGHNHGSDAKSHRN